MRHRLVRAQPRLKRVAPTATVSDERVGRQPRVRPENMGHLPARVASTRFCAHLPVSRAGEPDRAVPLHTTELKVCKAHRRHSRRAVLSRRVNKSDKMWPTPPRDNVASRRSGPTREQKSALGVYPYITGHRLGFPRNTARDARLRRPRN